MEHLQHGRGSHEAAGDRLAELLAQRHEPLLLEEAAFAQADFAEIGVESRAVEAAVGALEDGRVGKLARHFLRGHGEAQAAGLLVKRRLADHLVQHLPVESDEARLLAGEAAAALLDLGDALLEGAAEGLDADVGAADRGDAVRAIAAEDVADAPDREADDQEPEQNDENSLAEPRLGCAANA